MNNQILSVLQAQKEALIARIPDLKYRFIDIFHPKLKIHIPFLPIRCFRDFYVYQGNTEEVHLTTFISSGSTNSIRARHSFSKHGLNMYAQNSVKGFKNFLKNHNFKNVVVISLVPSPADWPNSSLSHMIKMFEESGISIGWCNIENIDAEEISTLFLSQFENIPKKMDVIVFGTTFHHLLLTQSFKSKESFVKKENILNKFNFSVIDTGGTKGKTQSFTLDEIKNTLRKFYKSSSSDSSNKKKSPLKIFSEYGMCELASQAWSSSTNHNGKFFANQTLLPFAIDLEQNKILPENTNGFLGFIDTVNIESYGAIITEDIGQIDSDKTGAFHLIGRSPDASIKGCSLNVKNFKFTNSDPKENSNLSYKFLQKNQNASYLTFSSIWKNLDRKYWNEYDISDFKISFSSLYDFKDYEVSNNSLFHGKNVLLISAANTPISFVYPTILCGIQKAKSFTLKIPTLRLNDPLSERIRFQIIDLYKNINSFFNETDFFISESKSLENNFNEYDCILVFGTDETISIVQKKCNVDTKFLGFGDIKNAFVIDENVHSEKHLTTICSAWNGRGCLTPVCLFISSMRKDDFIHFFFKIFSQEMDKRFKSLKNSNFHEHNLLYIKSELKKNGYEFASHILHSKWVVIVDLSKISPSHIRQMNLDFSFGGSGFIFILPIEIKADFPFLSFENVFPKIDDFYKKL